MVTTIQAKMIRPRFRLKARDAGFHNWSASAPSERKATR